MFHNVNNKLVEIRDKMFPACNIQIWGDFLEPKFLSEFGRFFGIFFEVMFENGTSATVSQELADVLNGDVDTLCGTDEFNVMLEHFIVEITSHEDSHMTVVHAYHCRTIDELIQVLEREMRLNGLPVRTDGLVRDDRHHSRALHEC